VHIFDRKAFQGGGRNECAQWGGARSARRKEEAWGTVSRQAEGRAMGRLLLAVLALALLGSADADSQNKVHIE